MGETSHGIRGLQHDRLELLLFLLEGTQRFGINVLKVKEIIPAPRLTRVPHAHPAVCGVAHLRSEPLSVVDLSQAIGRRPLSGDAGGSIIITEFNRTMQGFLVRQVDRIAVCEWKEVVPPPLGSGGTSYITGVTHIEEQLVQILDVERILGEVVDLQIEGSALERRPGLADRTVLVVDDSVTARHQTAQTLDAIGVGHVMARDGREALALLRDRMEREGQEQVDMIISDIEMPEMDGYTLAREIRKDPKLASLYLLLHTSLNGAINAELAQKAGANDVLTKFVPEELAKAVVKGLGNGRRAQ